MHYYGRYHVAESPVSTLPRRHVRTETTLRAVDHEPKVGVLDQEDLIRQGIRCSTFIPGAKDVDALGSCTANAFTSGLSNVLARAVPSGTNGAAALNAFKAATGASGFGDVVGAEKFAIRFYHGCTDQTGKTSEEWPPTDCGSSGPYIIEYAKKLGLVAGDKIAVTADDLVSLMQTDGVLTGSPWFNSWEEPDKGGFIDGNGSAAALQAAIDSGVAGGHETYWSAIEKLVLTVTGAVTAAKTIVRGRNSWDDSWGDHGSYRVHLSTFLAIANNCDHRQLVPAAA